MCYQPTLLRRVLADVPHTAGSFPGWPPAPGAFRRSRSCLAAGANTRHTSHPRQIESPRVAISQVSALPQITPASTAPRVPPPLKASNRPGNDSAVAVELGGRRTACHHPRQRPHGAGLWDCPHLRLPPPNSWAARNHLPEGGPRHGCRWAARATGPRGAGAGHAAAERARAGVATGITPVATPVLPGRPPLAGLPVSVRDPARTITRTAQPVITSTPATVRRPRRSTRNRPCSRSPGSGAASLAETRLLFR